MSQVASPNRSVPPLKKLMFAAIPALLLLTAAEVTARLFPQLTGRDPVRLERAHRTITTGESPFFVPSPHTVFRLRPRKGQVNSLGFVGEELVREKEPGVIRIACLGASTTQGGNLFGRRGSYPFLLEQILTREGYSVEVMNFGVSNWTSAESLVNYVLNVQDYSPDIVIIHHGVNDVPPRLYPNYRSDFSHYRVPYQALELSWIERTLLSWSRLYLALRMPKYEKLDITAHTVLSGVQVRSLPAPGTEYGFRRNVATIGELAVLRKAKVAIMTMPFSRTSNWKPFHLGIEEHNEICRELCRERGYALIDLATLVDEHRELAEKQFRDLVHVKAKGNFVKARLAADALIEAGCLTPETSGAKKAE